MPRETVVTGVLRACMHSASRLRQIEPGLGVAAGSLRAPVGGCTRRHLQSRNSKAVENGIDFGLPLLNYLFEFVAQAGVSLAYTHGDFECERQGWWINFGFHRSKLQRTVVFLREEPGQGAPDDCSVHLTIGNGAYDRIGIFASGLEPDDLILQMPPGKGRSW